MQILLGNMGSNVKKKINVQDEDDLTPLHYAARYNQLEVLKLLVENHAGKWNTHSVAVTSRAVDKREYLVIMRGDNFC